MIFGIFGEGDLQPVEERVLKGLSPGTVIRGEHLPNTTLTILDSPGVVVEDGTYEAIIVQRSAGVVVRKNRVKQKVGGKDGILVWGSDRALVEDNTIWGIYGSNSTGTNDGIQIMPDPAMGRNGGNLGADRWWEHSRSRQLPEHRYLSWSLPSGRTLFYGFRESAFVDGVIVRRNVVNGSGRAGIFVYNAKNTVIQDNEVHDTFDAAITVEQTVGSKVIGNKGQFRAKPLPGGLSGGIAMLFLAERYVVERNHFPGQDFRWYPNNHPNVDGVVRSNVGQLFVCRASGSGSPWVQRLRFEDNRFAGKRIEGDDILTPDVIGH